MGAVIGIAVLVVIFGLWIAYSNWLTKGIKPRVFHTTTRPDQLRDLFTQKVAGSGWKVVDDGNPMVAQSPLATGIRQQISLDLDHDANVGRTKVRVGPQRWISKRGTPTKAHTIRVRLNSFVHAVRQVDPSINVELSELRSK